MIKIFLQFTIYLLLPIAALGYETNVHQQITKHAVALSNIEQYLNANLNIALSDKLNDGLNNRAISEWVELGSNWEDDSPRWLNHFYDPTTRKGLNIGGVPYGQPSLMWGRDSSDYSFYQARANYYLALTDTNSDLRQMHFATVFRALGQIIHLIEDKAVPAHVRNDAHPYYYENTLQQQRDMYEKLTREAANGAEGLAPLTYDGYGPVDLTTFNKFDKFWENNGKGLAEFTNKNFFSRDTNYNDPAYQNYHNPSPIGVWTTVEDVIDPFGFAQVEVMYLQGYATDNYRPELSIPINRLSAFSYLDFDADQYLGTRVYSLNQKVHEEYANILIPRAVGYSAGLMNYFFRGSLEISAPDQFIYAVADGSIIPHRFFQIKAKVKNTTPNEAAQAGILQAVARYKNRTDYQVDLSTDPPTAASVEADFSYSVSAPITITSLNSSAPTEFSFDFSSDPIPAGITDLYLQVIFKGTLGYETDTAVAVGMKDINEPMHIVVWNATDRFYLDRVLRTADEIKDNPELLNRAAGQYIDPYDVTTRISFNTTTTTPTTYQVNYDPLPDGRYGRMIILTDAPSFYMHVHRESTNPLDSLDSYWPVVGVVNQEIDGIFNNTQVYPFRTIIGHEWTAFARYYPDSTGIVTAPWPGPVDINPNPITYINQ